MKKRRLIKITVKTRETVSLSNDSAHETANKNQNSVCPVCHMPLSAILPAAESSAVTANIGKPTAELLPAKNSDRQELEIKGDR